MGIGDNLGDMAKKVQNLAQEHPEQADQILSKAEDAIDERTGGKYSEQLEKGAEQLKRRIGEQRNRPQ